eukprot:COSAG01_NODE_2028_length_8596_cov_9.004590_2_plen_253_part_00
MSKPLAVTGKLHPRRLNSPAAEAASATSATSQRILGLLGGGPIRSRSLLITLRASRFSRSTASCALSSCNAPPPPRPRVPVSSHRTTAGLSAAETQPSMALTAHAATFSCSTAVSSRSCSTSMRLCTSLTPLSVSLSPTAECSSRRLNHALARASPCPGACPSSQWLHTNSRDTGNSRPKRAAYEWQRLAHRRGGGGHARLHLLLPHPAGAQLRFQPGDLRPVLRLHGGLHSLQELPASVASQYFLTRAGVT